MVQLTAKMLRMELESCHTRGVKPRGLTAYPPEALMALDAMPAELQRLAKEADARTPGVDEEGGSAEWINQVLAHCIASSPKPYSADDLAELRRLLGEIADKMATDDPPAFPGKPEITRNFSALDQRIRNDLRQGIAADRARERDESFFDAFPDARRIRINPYGAQPRSRRERPVIANDAAGAKSFEERFPSAARIKIAL